MRVQHPCFAESSWDPDKEVRAVSNMIESRVRGPADVLLRESPAEHDLIERATCTSSRSTRIRGATADRTWPTTWRRRAYMAAEAPARRGMPGSRFFDANESMSSFQLHFAAPARIRPVPARAGDRVRRLLGRQTRISRSKAACRDSRASPPGGRHFGRGFLRERPVRPRRNRSRGSGRAQGREGPRRHGHRQPGNVRGIQDFPHLDRPALRPHHRAGPHAADDLEHREERAVRHPPQAQAVAGDPGSTSLAEHPSPADGPRIRPGQDPKRAQLSTA